MSQNWRKREVCLEVYFWYGVFACGLYINYWYVQHIEELPPTEVTLLFGLRAINFLALLTSIALFEGFFLIGRLFWLRHLLSASIGIILFVAVLDYLVYRSTQLHLPSIIRFTLEGRGGGLRGVHLNDLWFQSSTIWILLAAFLASAGAGVGAHSLSRTITLRKPLKVKLCNWVGLSGLLCVVSAVGFASEMTFLEYDSEWNRASRALPFSFTPYSTRTGTKIAITGVAPFRSGASRDVDKFTPDGLPPEKVLPPIVVVIVESLRADSIDSVTTPNLANLLPDCVEVSDSISNGNATHLGWYSLLMGRNPLYLTEERTNSIAAGSPFLRSLKNHGYEIDVISSPNMDYFGLDRIMFGRRYELVKTFWDTRKHTARDPCERDLEAIRRAQSKLDGFGAGKFLIVLLDSSHRGYFWPKDFTPRFAPYPPSADLFDLRFGRPTPAEIESLKNRYKKLCCLCRFIDWKIAK
jgi:hypothetical protein